MLEFEVNIETDVASVRITVELQTLTVAVVVSSLRIDVVYKLRPMTESVKPFTYFVFARRLFGNV